VSGIDVVGVSSEIKDGYNFCITYLFELNERIFAGSIPSFEVVSWLPGIIFEEFKPSLTLGREVTEHDITKFL
jgi:hypothetical protein